MSVPFVDRGGADVFQGGGSTFAVMTSVTVRAYPSLASTWYVYSYNTTADSDTYWSLATYFHSQLPTLSDKGVMGYYWAFASLASPPAAPKSTIFGVWVLPEKSADDTKEIMATMEEAISNNTFGWKDPVILSNYSLYVPDFMSGWVQNTPETVGVNVRLGSRLLGRKALETDPQQLETLLKKSVANPQNAILGNLVAGKGVKDVKIPGGSNAVVPAWRDAYVHYSKF